jgi:hypothetical protein
MTGSGSVHVNGAVIDANYVQAAQHLTVLQIRLRQAGVQAVYEPPEVDLPPQLVVSDPRIVSREDVIQAAPRLTDTNDVEWRFCWDWGEWICRVDRVDEAAKRITEMLRRP